MSNTRVSICNAALNLIGAASIAAFEEDSATAERCRSLYDQIRRAVLRDHPWSCAKRRTILAPSAVHPAFGYEHAFPLPKDFIRLYDANTSCYEIEDRHILANTNQINLVYIYDNDNEDTWDSMLVEAVTLLMASKLCKPITGSDAAGESAFDKYQRLLSRAKSVNAQERMADEMQYAEPRYIGSRY